MVAVALSPLLRGARTRHFSEIERTGAKKLFKAFPLYYRQGPFTGTYFAATRPSGREESKPFNLLTHIANRAAQPAYHVVVEIGIAQEFIVVSSGDYHRLEDADNELGTPMHWFRWVRASPPGLPIFKEHPTLLTDNVLMLALTSLELRTNHLFDATIRISAPGFSSTDHWAFVCRGATLNIHGPESEYAAKPVNRRSNLGLTHI
jgi:hypothetical protein